MGYHWYCSLHSFKSSVGNSKIMTGSENYTFSPLGRSSCAYHNNILVAWSLLFFPMVLNINFVSKHLFHLSLVKALHYLTLNFTLILLLLISHIMLQHAHLEVHPFVHCCLCLQCWAHALLLQREGATPSTRALLSVSWLWETVWQTVPARTKTHMRYTPSAGRCVVTNTLYHINHKHY